MNTPFWGNIDRTRLARAYVALAFAQDVAKGYVKEHASAHPILSALDMSAKLIEEILEDVLPEEDLTAADNADYMEVSIYRVRHRDLLTLCVLALLCLGAVMV